MQLTFRTLFRNPFLFSAAGLHPRRLLLIILLFILSSDPASADYTCHSITPLLRSLCSNGNSLVGSHSLCRSACWANQANWESSYFVMVWMELASCLALSENHFLSSFRNIHYFCGNTRIHYIKALNLGSTAKRQEPLLLSKTSFSLIPGSATLTSFTNFYNPPPPSCFLICRSHPQITSYTQSSLKLHSYYCYHSYSSS